MNLKNTFIILNIIKDIAKKWTSFKAYDHGIIDDKGVLVRKPSTTMEKDSYDAYSRFIINLKRIIQKFTGSNVSVNRLASLYLLKEGYSHEEADMFIERTNLPNTINESKIDYKKYLEELLDEFSTQS